MAAQIRPVPENAERAGWVFKLDDEGESERKESRLSHCRESGLTETHAHPCTPPPYVRKQIQSFATLKIHIPSMLKRGTRRARGGQTILPNSTGLLSSQCWPRRRTWSRSPRCPTLFIPQKVLVGRLATTFMRSRASSASSSFLWPCRLCQCIHGRATTASRGLGPARFSSARGLLVGPRAFLYSSCSRTQSTRVSTRGEWCACITPLSVSLSRSLSLSLSLALVLALALSLSLARSLSLSLSPSR